MTPPTLPRLPFFVYGTLRPGEANHGLLEGRTAAQRPAELPGAVLYDGPGYPYAVAVTGTAGEAVAEAASVHGDLVHLLPELYESVLADLDRLEEHVPGAPGNLYERVVREVWCDGRARAAWVYLAGEELARALRESGRLVPGGDWGRARQAHRPPGRA
ncbi:gamma-glutamylcyclotransferase family protein [Streptomyces sp. H10-C2]|uniref:gamma-glutamylcyclotransferase family protein n=1 Tax=unclassified Streptomyces TaxID=2593676 RepID=UPI0024BBEA52|nr:MULTISPECIES: gamma-glutamylcyclotransferase family protein [unclassified Streptomyces]MDJ0344649.1 gamma-glutamylcyclotransferase family protein [Streptomyces sp. PH10-H1]MDJ0373191.1 gamma-glutamylcyclotransferase family protein [Streptomyces sp. H10-C2]